MPDFYSCYTVDVWFSNYHAPHPDYIQEYDWRRYVVSAPDPVTAELIAVQMCYATHNYPVRSIILE